MGREERIGETASDISVFARSERSGELFCQGQTPTCFEPYSDMF
jgi:hypothetical protein